MSSCRVGATPGVVTVVLDEDEDCAKPAPDINVRAVVAANKILNIMHSPWNLWRAKSLARWIPLRRQSGVNVRKTPMLNSADFPGTAFRPARPALAGTVGADRRSARSRHFATPSLGARAASCGR